MNNPSTPAADAKAKAAEERAARLAEQLRENLKRRKAQGRGLAGQD